MVGTFRKRIDDRDIADIFVGILGDCKIEYIERFCECYGDGDEVRLYDVYLIKTNASAYILKKTGFCEKNNYEKLLKFGEFNVPKYYGCLQNGDELWILIEYIKGIEVCNMTNEMAIAAADSVSEIVNFFWQSDEKEFAKNKVDDRIEKYFNTIEKRVFNVNKNSKWGRVYSLFLERQKSCPRTLSNGDLLQWNAIYAGGKVIIIDWGFGGIMPYSLDIARFIAHGRADRNQSFPFYMTDEQKEIFVEAVYKKLANKISKEQYLMDIQLALFNEYMEFIAMDEDENGHYHQLADKRANRILNGLQDF
jgi:thiamine kinase-like enzyme